MHGRPGTAGAPEFDFAFEALRRPRPDGAHQVTHAEMHELVLGAGVRTSASSDPARHRSGALPARRRRSRARARDQLGVPREGVRRRLVPEGRGRLGRGARAEARQGPGRAPRGAGASSRMRSRSCSSSSGARVRGGPGGGSCSRERTLPDRPRVRPRRLRRCVPAGGGPKAVRVAGIRRTSTASARLRRRRGRDSARRLGDDEALTAPPSTTLLSSPVSCPGRTGGPRPLWAALLDGFVARPAA